MILLAILFPTLYFLFSGQIGKGILCFILMVTFIGWIPASIWAIIDYNDRKADKRVNRLIDNMKK